MTYRYARRANRLRPIDGVSLGVKPGELVAILGHNGSGKSTLAKHFNAILLPQGGACYVDGIDTADGDRLYDIRQRVGMVFQNPDNQSSPPSCGGGRGLRLENLGVEPAEIRRRVEEALRSVGMHEYRNTAPSAFRRAEARVAIAGIIASAPGASCWTSPPPCWTPGPQGGYGDHPPDEPRILASPCC
jgi:energy-coupling factor transport system ATP-binding protein